MGAADDPDPDPDPDGDGGAETGAGSAARTQPEDPDIEDLLDELENLEETVDTSDERQRVREAMRVARRVRGGAFGRVVRGYDTGDVAEALLGSLLFGIPMAVEGGTNEAGEFLATRPTLLAGTALAAVGIVVSILYVSDIQDVRVHEPFFGVVPRRLVGVLGVSATVAVALLTAWGRVDWAEPAVALATVVVALVPMSIGAALGDILPGS